MQTRCLVLAAVLPLACAAQPPGGTPVGQLVSLLKERNLELKAARQRLAQAEARVRQSALRPNPRLEVDNKGNGRGAGPRETELALVQPIEIGGRRSARIGVAEAELTMTRFEVAELERRLVGELRLRAGEGLAAAARLRALEEALGLHNRMRKATVLRVSAGDASRFELALSEAESARLAAARQPLLAVLETDLAAIKTLCGLAQDEPLVLAPEDLPALLPPDEPVEEASRVAQALARRPDLEAARWRLKMAQSGIRLARAEAYPGLGVLVGFKSERAAMEIPGVRPPGDWLFRFGVTVSLPVFNRNQGRLEETAALAAEARLAAEAAEQAVRRDVRAAVRKLELARESLRAVRANLLPQAEAAVRIAATGYDLGELGLQQLVLEQQRLIDARTTAIQAGLEVYRAGVELQAATAE